MLMAFPHTHRKGIFTAQIRFGKINEHRIVMTVISDGIGTFKPETITTS